MKAEAVNTDAAAAELTPPGAATGGTGKLSLTAAWVVGLVLGALYAYAVAAGVGNLLGMGEFLGDALGPLPWTLLGLSIFVPIAALIVALVVARDRGAWGRVLLLATGLCVAAAIQLEIMHLIS